MNVILTVGGIPFDELDDIQRENTKNFVTDEVEKIVSQVVLSMIEKGKSLDEIKKSLKIC